MAEKSQRSCLGCKKFMEGLASWALASVQFSIKFLPLAYGIWRMSRLSLASLLHCPMCRGVQVIHRVICASLYNSVHLRIHIPPNLSQSFITLPPTAGNEWLVTPYEKHVLTFLVSCGLCFSEAKQMCVHTHAQVSMIMCVFIAIDSNKSNKSVVSRRLKFIRNIVCFKITKAKLTFIRSVLSHQ